MNEKELKFILQEGEGLKIEFKESFDPKSIAKEIVAFANAEGGKIFVGVNDKGEAKGIGITNKLKSQVQDLARNCDPKLNISLEGFNKILIIEVQEGTDKPYKCSEGFYLRVGPNSQKMKRDEILDLIMTVNKKTFDSLTNEGFDIKKDLDTKRLKEYFKLAKLSLVLPKKGLLKTLGVFDNQRMNNAGVLFFSKEPQNFFPQSVYTAVVFRDLEGADVIQRKEISGSLFEIVEKIMEFVEFYVRVAYKFTGKPQRENIYEYPLEAIRESVINSVMHKDYFEAGHNNILKFFPNRIEIENVWKKPKHFEIGKTVFRRNPVIANLFSRIRFGEKLGSGFARINEYCKKEKAPYPKIKFTDIHFYVVFEQNPSYLELAELPKGKVPKQLGERLGERLGENQERILTLISKNKLITIPELSKGLKISTTAVENNLSKLKRKGLLKRVGPAKGGRWEVMITS